MNHTIRTTMRHKGRKITWGRLNGICGWFVSGSTECHATVDEAVQSIDDELALCLPEEDFLGAVFARERATAGLDKDDRERYY